MPVVGAFTTSHAYTFQERETWDQRRVRAWTNVAKKAGRLAEDTAQAQAEMLEDNRTRYPPIRDAREKTGFTFFFVKPCESERLIRLLGSLVPGK
jgi:hypothetical protein